MTGFSVETQDKSPQQASWITKLSSLFSIQFVPQERWLEMYCKMISMNLISSIISFAHGLRNSQRCNFLLRRFCFLLLCYRHFNTRISIASIRNNKLIDGNLCEHKLVTNPLPYTTKLVVKLRTNVKYGGL